MRLFYTTILTLLFFQQILLSQNFHPEKVSLKLMEAMAASPNAHHSINIVLADRVDFEALDADLGTQGVNAGQRSAAVIHALKEKAAQTQGRVLNILQNSNGVIPGSIKSSWIANAFFAEANNQLIAELSHHPEIEWIGLNGIIQYEQVEEVLPPPFLVPDGTEPGLRAIKAPALWAMGYTGYGQLTMTSDTGVDPTHPALDNQYYGHYVPAEQTWYEVDGSLNPTGNYKPYDGGEHGTHVTGTTLGLDRLTNDTIGVAFNANWIGALTLGGIGTADNIGAFEWALDPDGDPNTADDMPDAINNSWHDPSLNQQDCFSVYRPVFEALEVAGIAVVFSAGNAGPDPSTITLPKNININEVNVFCVGSVEGNSNSHPIANSSSRGPSQCNGADSSLVIKPEVSAPGISVRSSYPGNNYGNSSGTSMAAPHVTGAILLLKEAFPDLPGKDLKEALYYSCTDLGDPGEDNTYGMGIINVLEAFNYLVDLGHVPVPPHRANDVMLVNVFNPPYFCDSEVNPTILVENAGTDTLRSFKAFYKVGASLGNYQWNGMLPPRQRLEVTLPAITVNAGANELEMSVEEPNGLPDERPLNNRFTTSVLASDRENFKASVEGPSNSVCKNTPALLRGVLPDNLKALGASLAIDWYTAAVGGTLLGSGEVFTTPGLSENTTFYADVEYIVPIGPKNYFIGDSNELDMLDIGLRFQVDYNMTLEKVTVFKDQTGGVILRLLDANGDVLKQKIALTQTTGELEIELDWDIEPGTYSIIQGGGKPLYANTDGATYPYSIEDVMSITGTTDGQGVNGAYYYFYNWKVSYREPCGRKAVNVDVGPVGTGPQVEYTLSVDTVNIADNEEVLFNSTTTNAVAWYWNFGDGNQSNDENTSHIYQSPGNYMTSLIAVDTGGCTGAAFLPLVVKEETINIAKPSPIFDNVLVYPNPVKERLSVLLDLPGYKNLTLRLTDSTGRIWSMSEHGINNGVIDMDVNGIPPGIYFLSVEMDLGSSVWKVVKL